MKKSSLFAAGLVALTMLVATMLLYRGGGPVVEADVDHVVSAVNVKNGTDLEMLGRLSDSEYATVTEAQQIEWNVPTIDEVDAPVHGRQRSLISKELDPMQVATASADDSAVEIGQ